MSADRAVMQQALPQAVLDFDQLLNEPPSDEATRTVRDFRLDAYPRWVKALDAMRQALAATPEPAQPLSDDQVADLLQEKHFSKGYVLKHSDRTCLAWYRLGLRDGEAAHGIKGEVKPS